MSLYIVRGKDGRSYKIEAVSIAENYTGSLHCNGPSGTLAIVAKGEWSFITKVLERAEPALRRTPDGD